MRADDQDDEGTGYSRWPGVTEPKVMSNPLSQVTEDLSEETRSERRSKGMKKPTFTKQKQRQKKKEFLAKRTVQRSWGNRLLWEVRDSQCGWSQWTRGRRLGHKATEVSRTHSLWLGFPSMSNLHPSIQSQTCPPEDVFQAVIITLSCAGQRSGDLMTRGTVSSVLGVLWVDLLTLHHPWGRDNHYPFTQRD